LGGFVFALANEYSLLDSGRLAVASGTAAVMTDGTDLCKSEDVWKLYEKIKKMS